MTLDEIKKIIQNKESENLEFKDWKNQVSFDGDFDIKNKNKCILAYCVAIGNERGGYLIIGVDDDGVIVGTNTSLAEDFKKKVFDHLQLRVETYEVYEGIKKVIIIKIPSRPIGKILEYAGYRLMRVDESLEKMTQQQEFTILSEGQDDWSAKICTSASESDLNSGAVLKLRTLYKEKNPTTSIDNLSDIQFLQDLGLIKNGAITNACILLVGNKNFIDSNLGQSEICFEYRNKETDIQFVDRKDYRDAFVLIAEEIWSKVYSRQQIHQIQQGLFRTDIPAYNEEVFREALFNAVCHRDYAQQGSIFVKQSPEVLEVSNPGGFPFGVSEENIITVSATPRNRLLAESFQRLFKGVERSGQGADKIFRLTIEEGKGSPSYKKSDNHHVVVMIPAIVQDGKFISYIQKVVLEKQIPISIQDLLLLEKIRIGDKNGITLETVGHLLERGIIELFGKTRGAYYVLAQEYYQSINALGSRTKRIGLSRDKCKELILEHLRKHKTGNMGEFKQIFPELKPKDITNMLSELKSVNRIKNTASGRWAIWVIIND